MDTKVKWACPKCAANTNKHGKGGAETCKDPFRGKHCSGFVCECSEDTDAHHGETYADPCSDARCYHCGWEGTFPKVPGKMPAWAKQALKAGWTPPEGWQP